MAKQDWRFRSGAAWVLLTVALVFAAVAITQLFWGVGADPRDTMGSRAAGFGWSDRAHEAVFGAVPLGLPIAAYLLCPRDPVRLAAAVEYVLLMLLGVLIAGSAFFFRVNLADEQRQAAGTIFVTDRAAVEFLLLDLAMLASAGVALAYLVTRRRGGPTVG